MSSRAVLFVSALDYQNINDGYAFYSRDLLQVLSELVGERHLSLSEVVLPRSESTSIGKWWRLLKSLLMLRSHFAADYPREFPEEAASAQVIFVNHYRALVALNRAGFFSQPSETRVVYVAHNVESASLISYASEIRASNWIKSLLIGVYAAFLMLEERRLARRCNAVITLTGEDKQRFIEFGLSAPTILVVPPVSVNHSVPAAATRASDLTLSLTGSFYWEVKRQNLFSFLRIAKASGRRFIINVVGSGLKDLPLADHYDGIRIFDGFESRERILRHSNAIVIPERQKSGMKLKALEAFAMKRVAIAHVNSVEGLPDWIGEVWFLYDSDEHLRQILEALSCESIEKMQSAFDVRWASAMELYQPHSMKKRMESILKVPDA